jgi:hypothetical protein
VAIGHYMDVWLKLNVNLDLVQNDLESAMTILTYSYHITGQH